MGGDAGIVTTYVALLRAINLGPTRKVAMADLVRCFGEAGCDNVKTYIQSGNVVFDSRSRSSKKLASDLERQVKDATGLDVPVILRTAAEMASVVERNPFPGVEPTKLLVGFMAGDPPADAAVPVERATSAKEEFVISGREIYLHLPDGAGRSKVPPALERIKTPVTARNWRTVTKLLEMATSR